MNLAQVDTITEITPIEGADKIVLATVQGWQCIIKKDEYNVGDKCVFIFIDTEVDTDDEIFSFLKKKPTDTWKAIKTIKMKGVFSQGLVMTMDILKTLTPEEKDALKEGDNVSHLLPIRKYVKDVETNMSFNNTVKAPPFPTEKISKTDEDNAKTKKKALDEYRDLETYFTLKMDGCSLTIIYDKESKKITCCSRNYVIEDEDNSLFKYVATELSHLQEIFDTENMNYCIQGEFVGPKINGNQLKLSSFDFYVFNVKNNDTDKYYGLEELQKFCSEHKLKMVPLLKVEKFNNTLKELQEYCNSLTYDGYASKNGILAEGIVFRPTVPVFSTVLHKNLSLKIINQNYKD